MDVRKLKSRPKDEELKEIYGLYKQSIIGDINIGACPVMLDMKGKANWEAADLVLGQRSLGSSSWNICIEQLNSHDPQLLGKIFKLVLVDAGTGWIQAEK
ncbi:hypothetical protein U0070_020542, partial [Myodes glareolus]